MNRARFGFVVGFACATVWAVAGLLVMIAAVFAGLLGLGVALVLDGRVDINGFVERMSAGRR